MGGWRESRSRVSLPDLDRWTLRFRSRLCRSTRSLVFVADVVNKYRMFIFFESNLQIIKYKNNLMNDRPQFNSANACHNANNNK